MLLNVAKQFSNTPGPRYISEGKFSGEQFRATLLKPKIEEAMNANAKLTINLDGTYGYGTSFLEESFGGLIRNDGMSLAELQTTIQFVSEEDPALVDEILGYMADAHAAQEQ